MTFPGAKTIHYSIFTPERLYQGPINSYLFKDFPIVIGETKKDYLMRIIKYRMKNSTNKRISDEEILILADIILDYYSKNNPCIAFIDINNIKNIPTYEEMYNYRRSDAFYEFYNAMLLNEYELKYVFLTELCDQIEMFNRGNYVTLSSFINKESISLVDFPDWYNLRQAFLKRVGIPDGTLVSYSDCSKLNSLDEISDDIKVLYRTL